MDRQALYPTGDLSKLKRVRSILDQFVLALVIPLHVIGTIPHCLLDILRGGEIPAPNVVLKLDFRKACAEVDIWIYNRSLFQLHELINT